MEVGTWTFLEKHEPAERLMFLSSCSVCAHMPVCRGPTCKVPLTAQTLPSEGGRWQGPEGPAVPTPFTQWEPCPCLEPHVHSRGFCGGHWPAQTRRSERPGPLWGQRPWNSSAGPGETQVLGQHVLVGLPGYPVQGAGMASDACVHTPGSVRKTREFC